MIRSLRFYNFYSFLDEAEVSFRVGRQPAPSGYDLSLADGSRGNKVIAVLGPNGSGKTQFLKPFAFLSWFVAESYLRSEPDDSIPFQPHAFARDKPTGFELEFDLEGEQYRYRLEVKRDHVLHESLHRRTSRTFSYVFVRERTGDGYELKQKRFGFPVRGKDTLRENSSIIAVAHVHDVPLAARMVRYFRAFSHNLHVSGRNHFEPGRLLQSARFFHDHPDLSQRANQLLCEMDLGLDAVELEAVQIRRESEVPGKEEEAFIPMGIHRAAEGRFKLSFFDESSGTQAAYVLLESILPVLAKGGVAIVDELDNDLHPHMLEPILDMFRHEHHNPHAAQLIFSCHTPEVLNLLAKHQVYLTEKKDLKSEAWRLDDVTGLRADDNLYGKYHSGALGAIPDF
ncbi:AAA family ATPase [Ectothiorhodospira shaposhnikovii]|uniref:AAA family ATPase n=1 Tax=Ectothiorhodospira shaposhnikovii TaxID=1054 RepID=UPI0039A086C0